MYTAVDSTFLHVFTSFCDASQESKNIFFLGTGYARICLCLYVCMRKRYRNEFYSKYFRNFSIETKKKMLELLIRQHPELLRHLLLLFILAGSRNLFTWQTRSNVLHTQSMILLRKLMFTDACRVDSPKLD